MAMRRAVDQLGPMALAVVSLSIIIGIGSVVLAELGDLSVLSNSTTASDTITAGQEALGTFGDFFTVIVVVQENSTPATQEHYMLETPAKAIDRKGDRMGQSAGNQEHLGTSEAIRAPSTLTSVDEDFVQVAMNNSNGLNRFLRCRSNNLLVAWRSKAYRSTGYGIEA